MNERRYHCFGCRDFRGGKLIRKPNLTLSEAELACNKPMFEYLRDSGTYETDIPTNTKILDFGLFSSLYEDGEFMGNIYSTYAGETGVAWPVCYEAQEDGTLEEVKFSTAQVYEAYLKFCK